MPNFAFLDQIEQKINLLLSAKKYGEAFNLCKKYLTEFPGEERFIKIKEKIEHYVFGENSKLIKEKLANLKPYWKEEKYSDILRALKELLGLQPDNSELKKLYLEAETKYKKQIVKLQEEFQQQQDERLNGLLQNQPEQLIEELYLLERENLQNKMVKDMVAKYRDRLVEKKIKEKAELLNSEKYTDIENFLQLLLKIDETNPRILKIEQTIKTRKFSTQVDQSREYIYSGEKHLDTLMKLKKYDKVIQVANEIIEVDKNNKVARKFLNKASAKYEHQLKQLAITAIIQSLPDLKTEYAKDKSRFIKI